MNTSERRERLEEIGGAMRVPATERSLANRLPDVAAEWDSIANSGITPARWWALLRAGSSIGPASLMKPTTGLPASPTGLMGEPAARPAPARPSRALA